MAVPVINPFPNTEQPYKMTCYLTIALDVISAESLRSVILNEILARHPSSVTAHVLLPANSLITPNELARLRAVIHDKHTLFFYKQIEIDGKA